jgi:hypothetical protein
VSCLGGARSALVQLGRRRLRLRGTGGPRFLATARAHRHARWSCRWSPGLGGVPAVLMTLAMMTSRTAPYLLRALARQKIKAPSTADLMT